LYAVRHRNQCLPCGGEGRWHECRGAAKGGRSIAANPEAGDIMPGCGGARKLRVAQPGGGKSGGYRVITYYADIDVPTFLLTLFGKNEKASLTKGKLNALPFSPKR
jgi:hypothetical protein